MIFNYQHDSYDWSHLSKRKDYEKKLSPTQQSMLQSYFNDIKPTVTESFLADNVGGNDEKNSYLMGSYYFIRDEDRICSKLIDTLYNLRNVLFHGELVPDNKGKIVYEAAYHILFTLIQELK